MKRSAGATAEANNCRPKGLFWDGADFSPRNVLDRTNRSRAAATQTLLLQLESKAALRRPTACRGRQSAPPCVHQDRDVLSLAADDAPVSVVLADAVRVETQVPGAF